MPHSSRTTVLLAHKGPRLHGSVVVTGQWQPFLEPLGLPQHTKLAAEVYSTDTVDARSIAISLYFVQYCITITITSS
jgi:hypothetical protein